MAPKIFGTDLGTFVANPIGLACLISLVLSLILLLGCL